MAEKNDIPVVINGRIYNLSGYENMDYLQTCRMSSGMTGNGS